MRHVSSKSVFVTAVYVLVMASLFLGVKPLFSQQAAAAELASRSLKISSATAGQTVRYDLSFTLTTAGALGSVKIDFCSNSALPDDPCTAPDGLDVSGATILSESGVTDFSILPTATSANSLTLTRTPSTMGANSAVTVDIELGNVVNPAHNGSYFARVGTYTSADASGSYVDHGGIAFSINPTFSINTEVPPYLTFCLGNTIPANNCNTAQGNYVNVGDMGPTFTSSGQTQLLTATNATNGYNITITGGTLTSGNNEIPVITPGGMSVAGISQFGINLRANTNPQTGQNPSGPGSGQPTTAYNQQNHYRYYSGDIIASSSAADDYRKYTVSYIINVGANQPPGVYATTFTYVCLGNF